VPSHQTNGQRLSSFIDETRLMWVPYIIDALQIVSPTVLYRIVGLSHAHGRAWIDEMVRQEILRAHAWDHPYRWIPDRVVFCSAPLLSAFLPPLAPNDYLWHPHRIHRRMWTHTALAGYAVAAVVRPHTAYVRGGSVWAWAYLREPALVMDTRRVIDGLPRIRRADSLRYRPPGIIPDGVLDIALASTPPPGPPSYGKDARWPSLRVFLEIDTGSRMYDAVAASFRRYQRWFHWHARYPGIRGPDLVWVVAVACHRSRIERLWNIIHAVWEPSFPPFVISTCQHVVRSMMADRSPIRGIGRDGTPIPSLHAWLADLATERASPPMQERSNR